MHDVPSIPESDDRTLLHAWSRARDEAAFTQFVQRHLGMVQGAALRKTTRHELAEDVTQAVFALAARRAASLAEHPCAGAWLHRTAVFESANALRRERKQRQLAAAMLTHPDTSPDAGPGLPDAVLPHLDDALNALPEHDRRAVLLRFGERLSYDQMAARLGKSADACQKQTSRALDRLRGLLARHRALPATTIAAGLTSALSTPATAAAAKVSTAALVAAPQISLAAVFQHALHTMSTGKQIVVAAAALLLLASVPLGLQMSEAATLRAQVAARLSPGPVSTAVKSAAPAGASPMASASVLHETPGSRIAPGVGKTEADRILALLRTLKGRMLTSSQLLDISRQIMDLPLSHMQEALQAIADFPGMMPAVPLRLAIFSRWGELDPDAAVTAAAKLKDDINVADLIRSALVAGWMERDPAGMIAWLREHPRDNMADKIVEVLGSKITLFDRETVEQLRTVAPTNSYPGQLLLAWEARAENGDVAKLAAELWLETKEDYLRNNLVLDVARILSDKDPRAALDFVLAHPDPKKGVNQYGLAQAIDAWVAKDFAAAATWAWSQGRNNEDGATHVWKALSFKSEEEILSFLAKAPDESARLYSLQRTALESAGEPEKSLRLLAALPDEQRHEALESFGQIRAGESLMKTSEWLLALPDGPDKDAAIRGFAPVLAKSEAESAMIWAASIAGQAPRAALLRKLGQEWMKKSPDAARQWMNSTDKLTDSDRAAIISNQ